MKNKSIFVAAAVLSFVVAARGGRPPQSLHQEQAFVAGPSIGPPLAISSRPLLSPYQGPSAYCVWNGQDFVVFWTPVPTGETTELVASRITPSGTVFPETTVLTFTRTPDVIRVERAANGYVVVALNVGKLTAYPLRKDLSLAGPPLGISDDARNLGAVVRTGSSVLIAWTLSGQLMFTRYSPFSGEAKTQVADDSGFTTYDVALATNGREILAEWAVVPPDPCGGMPCGVVPLRRTALFTLGSSSALDPLRKEWEVTDAWSFHPLVAAAPNGFITADYYQVSRVQPVSRTGTFGAADVVDFPGDFLPRGSLVRFGGGFLFAAGGIPASDDLLLFRYDANGVRIDDTSGISVARDSSNQAPRPRVDMGSDGARRAIVVYAGAQYPFTARLITQ